MRADSAFAAACGDMAAGMTRSQLLARFLEDAAARPFSWGEENCWFFVADWIALMTGRDPAAPMRGTFVNRFGCLRAVVRRGGCDYLDAAQQLANAVALRPIVMADARPGDIAAAATPDGHVGLICTGRRWAGKTHRGISIAVLPASALIKAWAVDA
jgi:hypothetical protein